MALAIYIKMNGGAPEPVRFYREPKRAGGNLLGVLPEVDRDPWVPRFRDAVAHEAGGLAHVTADPQYVRNLRTATDEDRSAAEDMLRALGYALA